MKKIDVNDPVFQKMVTGNDEEIVSMDMIAHRTEKYARINTVVTDRKYRGKGYAKMLVGEISRKLIENKMIPMLYADAHNPSSNLTYQKIGYVKVGEITEFAVNFIKSKTFLCDI